MEQQQRRALLSYFGLKCVEHDKTLRLDLDHGTVQNPHDDVCNHGYLFPKLYVGFDFKVCFLTFVQIWHLSSSCEATPYDNFRTEMSQIPHVLLLKNDNGKLYSKV